MLTECQVHKEVDGHVLENVKDDNGIANDGDNYRDHALEDVKTLVNEEICNNENILLDFVTNSIQSIDDMSP